MPLTLERYRETSGQWPADLTISEAEWTQGKQLIEQLVASGPVSGFKDPRTALTWPFWRRVLQDFPGLRVVPLFLIRSPHEIAMSLFRRVHGDHCYVDALDVAAVHFRRMKSILDEWQGDHAVLQFAPPLFTWQAPKAVEMCGLKWDESIFAEVYDPSCRHFSPAMIVHDAQSLFERMGGSGERLAERDNLRKLMADSAIREEMFRQRLADVRQSEAGVREELAQVRSKMSQVEEQCKSLHARAAEHFVAEDVAHRRFLESVQARVALEERLEQSADRLREARRSA